MNSDKEGTSSKKQKIMLKKKHQQKRKTKKAGSWKLTWKKKKLKQSAMK